MQYARVFKVSILVLVPVTMRLKRREMSPMHRQHSEICLRDNRDSQQLTTHQYVQCKWSDSACRELSTRQNFDIHLMRLYRVCSIPAEGNTPARCQSVSPQLPRTVAAAFDVVISRFCDRHPSISTVGSARIMNTLGYRILSPSYKHALRHSPVSPRITQGSAKQGERASCLTSTLRSVTYTLRHTAMYLGPHLRAKISMLPIRLRIPVIA